MQLELHDAIYAADQFIDYFSNMGRIDEYLRAVKLDRMQSMPKYLPGMGPEEDMFADFDMHPNDMEFGVYTAGSKEGFTNEYFNERLQITTSHAIEDSIPGKSLKWIVMEKNTKKIVGFIRFGSPTINSKPRNEWLGKVPDLKIFNRHAIMGFIIVPTQPFGFNYLGGKLLALMCCSHEAREQLNAKYGSDICLFETTSLYGSTKSSSQYDGLKPYLRYKGLTESNFTPLIHDKVFKDLNKWFIDRNNNENLVKDNASSRKLKTQQRMIQIIKNSLRGEDKLIDFNAAINNAKSVTEQKRTYFSDYGFSNVREVINGDQMDLIKNPINFDKFYMDNLVNWWRNKASKRYESLKSENRLRNELETWNKDMNIDIIR